MSSAAEAFVKMLPFLVAGAFLPTWTAQVILLLGTKRPLGNAFGFIGGNATFRLLLGLAALFVLGADQVEQLTASVSSIPAWVYFAVGAALLIPGVLLVVRHSDMTAASGPPRWLGRLEGFPPWASFVWGFLSVASPGEQYVTFLAAVAVISAAGLPAWESIALLIVAVAFEQVLLVTPVAIYLAERERADAVFRKLKSWLARNGSQVAGGILIAIGLLLVVLGLR